MSTPSAPELVIERVFDAPRAMVWRAWTDPKQAVLWGGPPSHPATHMEGDLRPGGKWRGCLRSVETGEELWQGGVYREVREPERIVYTFYWEGDDGQPENEMLITLTFTEEGSKTRMKFHQTEFGSVEQRDRHRGGWSGVFDRLAEFLATKSA